MKNGSSAIKSNEGHEENEITTINHSKNRTPIEEGEAVYRSIVKTLRIRSFKSISTNTVLNENNSMRQLMQKPPASINRKGVVFHHHDTNRYRSLAYNGIYF